ncbi:hypothetical protein [Treponema sp. Marseille-Q4523]|uniref:hypothetical protein n=1 Tax=Treponema sp. Marseille-Q4523 TaxID=2810610 RepID=UPI001961CD4C|nr:hypothetical protein [Treponema sp. Marseille-Q4523]MBM7022112.1 hypothetical protein [Treponema sp. Marseille-Q4523]
MKAQAKTLIDRFLRTYREVFSDKDFARILGKMGMRVTRTICEDYLASSDCVFALDDGLYITRAGAFSNRFFSFKPTRYEVEHKCFAAGARCMPFVDPEMLPSSFTFTYKGEVLPPKIVTFASPDAADLFALYGAEFASQYIAADPANEGLDLAAHDFELPSEVHLTVNSLEPLVKYCGFKYGDRILCRVVDWDYGRIEVVPVKRDENPMRMQADDLERQNWYARLESDFLESFAVAGPCASIEEQLACIFFDDGKALCTAHCGSVEEFLLQSRKVAYEPFGVETRLWKAGEEVPAVGTWNNFLNIDTDSDDPIFEDLAAPDFVFDAYIEDQLFEKKYDPDLVLERILPDGVHLKPEERKILLLHIDSCHAIIKKDYNWFADFHIGPLRRRALALYRKASRLVLEIDRSAVNLERYPQQELVILSQIYNHVLRMLEMIEREPTAAAEDVDEIAASLDGMECNFEDISGELTDAVKSESGSGFVVVK